MKHNGEHRMEWIYIECRKYLTRFKFISNNRLKNVKISEIKKHIMKDNSIIQSSDQSMELYFNNTLLDERFTCQKYKIKSGSVLNLVIYTAEDSDKSVFSNIEYRQFRNKLNTKEKILRKYNKYPDKLNSTQSIHRVRNSLSSKALENSDEFSAWLRFESWKKSHKNSNNPKKIGCDIPKTKHKSKLSKSNSFLSTSSTNTHASDYLLLISSNIKKLCRYLGITSPPISSIDSLILNENTMEFNIEDYLYSSIKISISTKKIGVTLYSSILYASDISEANNNMNVIGSVFKTLLTYSISDTTIRSFGGGFSLSHNEDEIFLHTHLNLSRSTNTLIDIFPLFKHSLIKWNKLLIRFIQCNNTRALSILRGESIDNKLTQTEGLYQEDSVLNTNLEPANSVPTANLPIRYKFNDTKNQLSINTAKYNDNPSCPTPSTKTSKYVDPIADKIEIPLSKEKQCSSNQSILSDWTDKDFCTPNYNNSCIELNSTISNIQSYKEKSTNLIEKVNKDLNNKPQTNPSTNLSNKSKINSNTKISNKPQTNLNTNISHKSKNNSDANISHKSKINPNVNINNNPDITHSNLSNIGLSKESNIEINCPVAIPQLTHNTLNDTNRKLIDKCNHLRTPLKYRDGGEIRRISPTILKGTESHDIVPSLHKPFTNSNSKSKISTPVSQMIKPVGFNYRLVTNSKQSSINKFTESIHTANANNEKLMNQGITSPVHKLKNGTFKESSELKHMNTNAIAIDRHNRLNPSIKSFKGSLNLYPTRRNYCSHLTKLRDSDIPSSPRDIVAPSLNLINSSEYRSNADRHIELQTLSNSIPYTGGNRLSYHVPYGGL